MLTGAVWAVWPGPAPTPSTRWGPVTPVPHSILQSLVSAMELRLEHIIVPEWKGHGSPFHTITFDRNELDPSGFGIRVHLNLCPSMSNPCPQLPKG